MKNCIKLSLTILWAYLLTSCAQTQQIQIKEPWARPGLAGGNSAVYFVIDNPTTQDDTLISASSDAALHVEIHLSTHDEHGTAMMKPQESVDIPANSTVEFAPGGLHVMLISLVDDLLLGDEVNLTLSFEKNGEINVEVIIENR
ncbi:MAG: copper chaperone PCu(A)C [Anaerolineales bacterium]|nr:copper chaperone PCu(A)C [Anaerolineales bacterium]